MLTTLGIIQRSVDNWKMDILLEPKKSVGQKATERDKRFI